VRHPIHNKDEKRLGVEGCLRFEGIRKLGATPAPLRARMKQRIFFLSAIASARRLMARPRKSAGAEQRLITRQSTRNRARTSSCKLIPLAMIDEAKRTQFEERACVVQKLNHINIARVFAFGVESGYLGLVSEYLRGETAMRGWLRAGGCRRTRRCVSESK